MADIMTFPETVEEFMKEYKVVDKDGVYMSKGSELVPIFRMRQWFEHAVSADVRPVVRGRWIPFTSEAAGDIWYCSACDVGFAHHMDFCPHCGADMREDKP